MKRIISFLAVMLLSFSLFSACTTKSSEYFTTPEENFDLESQSGTDSDSASEGNINQILVSGTDTEQKLIYHVSLSIRTNKYNENYTWIIQKLSEYGGYIYNEYTYGLEPETSNDSGRSASLTLKIPVEQLEQFLSDIESKGNVVSKQMDVEDTTEHYYDVEARIELLEARYARMEEYLNSATSIDDIIALETEMSDILYQLDELKGEKRGLDNQVSYSTVKIELNEIVNAADVSYQSDGLWDRIKNGLLITSRGVIHFLEDFFVYLVAALPILLMLSCFAGIIYLIVKTGINASRKRKIRKENKKTLNTSTPLS